MGSWNRKAVEGTGLQIAQGSVDGQSPIHKFGHNHLVGTTYVPIAAGGVWQTPQVSGATTLRVKAGGHANDTAAGTGAREVTLYGCDATGADIEESLVTAGASASASTTLSFLRLTRIIVTASGTYASATAGSHSADVVIENTAGTADWGTLPVESFAFSQSQIGAYTVPLGKTGYVLGMQIDVDSNKTVDALFFQRQNILETAAPYTAMRAIQEFAGVTGSLSTKFKVPLGPFPANTDMGFMAKVASGTASVSVDFAIVLIDD